MYGIKIYIRDSTPPKKIPKWVKILFILSALLFYSIFAVAGFYCTFYYKEIFASVLLFFCPLIVMAIFAIQTADFAKPYLIFTKTTVEKHTFILGIHRIKHFNITDVYEILNCSGNSFKVKGVRIPFWKYLVFRNKKGRYIFKLAVFPNVEETIKALFPDIEIKNCS